MLATKKIVASALLAVALPTLAAPVLLDFESVGAATSRVGDSYVDQGIRFSNNAWSYLSADFGGSGAFFRTPATRGAISLILDPTTPSPPGSPAIDFIINVEDGFTVDFAMLYTASGLGFGSVAIFDGLDGKASDGSDTSIGGFNLVPQPDCFDGGVPQPGYLCNWEQQRAVFSGKAFSVRISGVDGQFFFDNLSFGDVGSPPPVTVPEPGGVALSLAALGALALGRRRATTSKR